MIQPYSFIKVADNTGAKLVMCIRVLGGAKQKAAQLGDIILCSVKKTLPQSQIKKKELVRCLIIRQRKPYQRNDGTSIRFDDNAVILINPDYSPRGSRIFGPIAKEIRDRKYSKIVSLAPEVL